MISLWIGWIFLWNPIQWVHAQSGLSPASLSLLKNTRSQITLPKYSPDERSEILNQSKLLFTMYTNRALKMQQYGEEIDPIPRLEALDSQLQNVSDHDFHMTMFSIYSE